MKYMLLLYANESKVPQTAEEQQSVAPAWYAFAQEAEAAGVLLSNNGLSPVANATTVRVRDGKVLIATSKRRTPNARIIAIGRFNFDHIRAKIVENHRTIRASQHAAEIEYTNSVQWLAA